jgi:Tfp pilus assembly protein PilX
MTVGVRTERGVALIVCLIGIVVCGALVTGVFATGYVEQRIGDNTRWMERSFGVAEYGLSETIAQWNIGSFNQLLPGQRVNVAGAVPGGTGTYAGSVIRLN